MMGAICLIICLWLGYVAISLQGLIRDKNRSPIKTVRDGTRQNCLGTINVRKSTCRISLYLLYFLHVTMYTSTSLNNRLIHSTINLKNFTV